MTRRNALRVHRPQQPSRDRRGSTLLVVTVLMTMLASLGVIFYMFAAQERQTAEYYSDAAKARAFDLSVETLFDFGMEQVTVGPDPKFKNSALYGRRHSLIGNMLGVDSTGASFDRTPYNGIPMNPPSQNYSVPAKDYSGAVYPADPYSPAIDASTVEWIKDPGRDYWRINDSPVANRRRDPELAKVANRDPDYTYPDGNSVFLSYDSYVRSGLPPTPPTRVIIPSFHRPQSPRVRTLADWYRNAATADRVLRPHPNHLYVPRPGQQFPPGAPPPRFLDDTNPVDAAIVSGWGASYHGFPFTPPADTNGNAGILGEQGVWSPPPVTSIYEYDVDNDGDGIREGIWLDLDFPPQEDASGALYVPLYSFTIVDADALLNLNAHGNLARVWAGDQSMTVPFGDFTGSAGNPVNPTVGSSNQGLMPTEINPIWGFNRRPNAAAGPTTGDGVYATISNDSFFVDGGGAPVPPVNWVEAANREWLFLLMGRYNTGASTDLVPGRWGEEHLLYAAVTNNSTRSPNYFGFNGTTPLPNPWPGPGQTLIDDNGDYQQSVGGWFGAIDPATNPNFTPFGHPLDYSGLGQITIRQTSPASFTIPQLATTTSYVNGPFTLPARWPNYLRYSSEFNAGTTRSVQWDWLGDGATTVPPNVPAPATGRVLNSLMNDGSEVVLDGDSRRPEDNSFGADEMQALHMVQKDFVAATGGSSRLTNLAPFNLGVVAASDNLPGVLVDGNGAATPPNQVRTSQEFRSKFTTLSWDRKQFSLPFQPYDVLFPSRRPWEYNADADADYTHQQELDSGVFVRMASSSGGEFPPMVKTDAQTFSPYSRQDLFRPLLRRLLEVEANTTTGSRHGLRLNLNQLLVGANGDPFPRFAVPPAAPLPPDLELNYRPLTPHPLQTLLTATPIAVTTTVYPAGGNFNSPEQQEYWARVDRQLMARDLFALLYVLTWPDEVNPTLSNLIQTANPNFTASSREMFNTDPPGYRSVIGLGNTAVDVPNPGALDSSAADRPAHIRQLAQYAVNIVDSLDRDNIPTRFEYDVDLADGWSLDDNPFSYDADTTGSGGTINEPLNRNEVWGVERMDLTLSEVLVVRNDATGTMDLPFTQWADTADEHYTYVELRNPGPYDVDFANMNWRIEVGNDRVATTSTADAQVRVLTIEIGQVNAGETFTIGSGEQGLGAEPSVMKVALDGSAATDWDTNSAHWIAPAGRTLDLDLKKPSQAGDFTLTDVGGGGVTSGALVDAVVPGPEITFRLMRRASPLRPASSNPTEEADNPWIMVDQITVSNVAPGANTNPAGSDQSNDTEHAGDPDLQDGDTATDISQKLEGLRSIQRREPFNSPQNYFSPNPVATPIPQANSLGADNTNSPNAVATGFRRWQKVFDRDFASLGELLQITLGGSSNPEFLQNHPATTYDSGTMMPVLVNFVLNMQNVPTTETPGTEVLAESMFLNQIGSGATNAASHEPYVSDNDPAGSRRWYRVLEFLEVPTRMHAGIPGFQNAVDYPRVPGKINMNLIRHPETLAGMIDDTTLMELQIDEDRDRDGTITPPYEADYDSNGQVNGLHPPLLHRMDTANPLTGLPSESWWNNYLITRDGARNSDGSATLIDNYSGLSLALPGSVVLNTGGGFTAGQLTHAPFRSFAAGGDVANSDQDRFKAAERTALRSSPFDQINTVASGDDTPRQLFELGTPGDRNTNSVDQYVRRRLLNKILNNATTRSHVFVVFASVKFFRAADVNGVIRIGGPLKPGALTDPAVLEPEHRAFFVVDRSNLEKAYDPATNRYNFKALVQHAKILQ